MGKFKGMNQKASAAAERKAINQAKADSKAAAEREKELQKEWSKGANQRGANRAEAAANKADEAARKKQEKAALLAEEEANMGSSKPKKTPTLSKGKGKKKKNDLSLLEEALVSGADKKMKSKRASERQKQEKLKAEQRKRQQKEHTVDPLLTNTQNMISGTDDNMVGRAANKALDADGAGGIDGALDALNIGGAAVSEPSRKALYKAFEERKMAELKEDCPGLKLSQYKDKVFQAWKKSPENPANQTL